MMQAKAAKQKHKLQDPHKITASPPILGREYGVGIGLYFQIIKWLRLLLFWLALCMVGWQEERASVLYAADSARKPQCGAAGAASAAACPACSAVPASSSCRCSSMPTNSSGSSFTRLASYTVALGRPHKQLHGATGRCMHAAHIFSPHGLTLLAVTLSCLQVPFMIVANTSRFTTPQHAGQDDGASMSTLPTFNILQSLTFAVMPDDEVDKGLLSWMNIQLPGFEGVFSMPRAFFLICKQQLGVLGSGLDAGFGPSMHPCACAP